MKKNILFFIISIIIILIIIFTCTCINKYHILKDIYNMQNNLNKIENYSYLNNQTTQIIKKNNDIRVDKFDENITIYFDSQNNKLYNLDNNNMTMKIIDNGINHISVPLQKIDFINKSIIYNIFNTKITSVLRPSLSTPNTASVLLIGSFFFGSNSTPAFPSYR